MLWNPKFDKPTEMKADPFTLESLIAWLERQDASEVYRYQSIDDCPLARYFRAHGFRGAFCGATRFSYIGPWYLLWPLKSKPVSWDFNQIVLNEPQTYGAALERARAALAST